MFDTSSNRVTGAGTAFVLDDHPQIATLVAKILTMCGVTSRQFTSVEFFMAEVESAPPEFIILDLSLGTTDAVEVMRDLHHIAYRGKVLLISGRDEATLNETTQIGTKRGLTMLPPLKKPFRPADLKQRLSLQSTRAPRRETFAATSAEAMVQVVEALQKDWLDLWYQPKVDLRSFSLCGAEGLLRVDHPTHGLIAPNRLLAPANDSNSFALTEFAITRAILDWNMFSQRGWYPRLSINVPASVIGSSAFIGLVRSALPTDPNFPGLIIEVTEAELIRNGEWAHEIATQLKLYNVALSIDDFGEAYGQLSHLNDIPFTEVKIDRSLVAGCSSNSLRRGICQTIIDLAHRFGGTACADGVKHDEDLRALIDMGCDSAQGFLFSDAMPFAKLKPNLLDVTFSDIGLILQAWQASRPPQTA